MVPVPFNKTADKHLDLDPADVNVGRVMYRLAGPEVTELLARVEELAGKFCGP